jgi:hypothetical protein
MGKSKAVLKKRIFIKNSNNMQSGSHMDHVQNDSK